MKTRATLILVICVCLFITGCSGGSKSPVQKEKLTEEKVNIGKNRISEKLDQANVGELEPLTRDILKQNQKKVFLWFRDLEDWTNSVFSVIRDQGINRLDLRDREVIIERLTRYYTKTGAEAVFNEFCFLEKVNNNEPFVFRPINPNYGLKFIQANDTDIKVETDLVTVTGKPLQPTAYEQIREIFFITEKDGQLRVSGVNRNLDKKLKPPPPLDQRILKSSAENVYNWFSRLEQWTEDVIASGLARNYYWFDLKGRSEIIQELEKHYTKTEAERIFENYFYDKMDGGQKLFANKETELHDALRSIDKNLFVEIKSSSVRIIGTGYNDGPWTKIDETFHLTEENDRIKVNGVNAKNNK